MITSDSTPLFMVSRNKSIGLAVTALLIVLTQTVGVSNAQNEFPATVTLTDQTPAPLSSSASNSVVAAAEVVDPHMSDSSNYQVLDQSYGYQAQPCNCPACQAAAAGQAPAKAKPKGNPCAGSHKATFFDNDFSYLDEPGYSGRCLGDSLKGLGRNGNVDIGGQLRFRYHTERGMGQQAGATRFQDTQNDFLLARLRLYGDVKVSDRLRFYAEGIFADVLTANAQYVPRGIDRNYGDLLNLFLDVKVTDNSTVRLGRQELLFGAQRLVSPLDWANTRRTFDGVRLMQKWDDIKVSWFYSQFVPVTFDDFDNSDADRELFGFYSSYSGLKNSTLDLYALGSNDKRGGANDKSLVTFGSRLNGSKNDWLWDMEGMVQTGSFDAGGDIAAYSWTAGLGRSFSKRAWKPKLWFFYDYASGNSLDGNTQAFDQLYPLAHKYHGFIDAVQRSNLKSPNVQLSMSPTKRLSLLLWYHNFTAAEENDIVRSIGGTPAQDPSVSDFGNELDFVANFKATARTNILAGYSHLWAGDKIIGGNDADFFYLQWQTNF